MRVTPWVLFGPLMAVGLLSLLGGASPQTTGPYRLVFALTVIPGIGAGLAFAVLVLERRKKAQQGLRLWSTVRSLPHSYLKLLTAVGLFGLGNFAPTLLILGATQLLTGRYGIGHAAQIAGLLYVVHNLFYAGVSYPVGALSDRWGRRGLLALGYFAGGLVAVGFLAAFLFHFAPVFYLGLLFAVAGSFMGTQDSLEGAITADQTKLEHRGTAYGLMATVNGVGDFGASAVVGYLDARVSRRGLWLRCGSHVGRRGVFLKVRRSHPRGEIRNDDALMAPPNGQREDTMTSQTEASLVLQTRRRAISRANGVDRPQPRTFAVGRSRLQLERLSSTSTSLWIICRYMTNRTISVTKTAVTAPSPQPTPPELWALPVQSANDAPRGRVIT